MVKGKKAARVTRKILTKKNRVLLRDALLDIVPEEERCGDLEGDLERIEEELRRLFPGCDVSLCWPPLLNLVALHDNEWVGQSKKALTKLLTWISEQLDKEYHKPNVYLYTPDPFQNTGPFDLPDWRKRGKVGGALGKIKTPRTWRSNRKHLDRLAHVLDGLFCRHRTQISVKGKGRGRCLHVVISPEWEVAAAQLSSLALEAFESIEAECPTGKPKEDWEGFLARNGFVLPYGSFDAAVLEKDLKERERLENLLGQEGDVLRDGNTPLSRKEIEEELVNLDKKYRIRASATNNWPSSDGRVMYARERWRRFKKRARTLAGIQEAEEHRDASPADNDSVDHTPEIRRKLAGLWVETRIWKRRLEIEPLVSPCEGGTDGRPSKHGSRRKRERDRDWGAAGRLYQDGHDGEYIRNTLRWEPIAPESIERMCRRKGIHRQRE